MKKLLIFILSLMIINTYGQNDSSKINMYTNIGLSLTNGDDFKSNSFAAIETGFVKSNISGGLAIGRGSLSGINNTDNIKNYYYEIKTSAYYQIELVSANLIFGLGNFINTKYIFIEYGLGISYTPHKKISYCITYSNWNNVNYITPNISYNF